MSSVITFYSYKGGVGRSMALANVAVMLSRWGNKVLLVDFDLEAPGLEYFFRGYIHQFEEVRNQLGILNLINISASGVTVNWRDYLLKIPISHDGLSLPFIENSLDLIRSGNKASDNYIKELSKFNAGDFYKINNGGLIIENLRQEWKENYDYILIDSRTGVTDIGGICTIHLPDILVTLFTATEQGWDGIKETSQKAIKNHCSLPFERDRLKILPIHQKLIFQKKI